MLNRVNNSMENKVVNTLIEIKKQGIEGKTNQAPSNLALNGRVDVDQELGTTSYYDNNDILMQQTGYLPRTGKYGTLMFDSAGIPIQLSGQHPVDGHVNTWITKPGVDVVTALGG